MAKAPFVAMQTDLPKEVRVELIAEVTGHDRDAVLGKLFRLWAWCTDRGLQDAPDDCDGYAVPERVIRQFLGERGVEAMLGDGCDELAMGERRQDGLIYLRGTHETVSRLRALRSTAVTGGRSAAGGNKRGAGGRFVSNQQFDQPTVQPATSCGPADDQPATSRPPAAASEIPQTTDHREEDLPPARDPTNHHLPSQESRAEFRASVRAELETARSRAGLARRVQVRPLLAFDHGLDVDLGDHLAKCRSTEDLEKLRSQASHAIAMAELEVSRGGKSFEWFTGAIFSGRNFTRLVGMTDEDARRSRDGPSGSPRRDDRPPERKNTMRPM